MKTVADRNASIAAALKEPEKNKIIELAEGHELIAQNDRLFPINEASPTQSSRKLDINLRII
jgi:hypothetical protein